MTESETQNNRLPTPGVTPYLLSRYETGHKDDKATAPSTPNAGMAKLGTRSNTSLTKSAPQEQEKGIKDPALPPLNGQTASACHSKPGADAEGRKKTKRKAVSKSAPKGPPLSTGKHSGEIIGKILKESFSNLAQSMQAGCSNLGECFKPKIKN